MPNSLTPSVLTWMRAFDTAVRHASFTRAADELCLTQGSISQQVKQLEVALGTALFHRDRGALRLTAEGDALHSQIGGAFCALRSAAERLGDATTARPIKFSCSPSFAVRWLGSRTTEFMRQQSKFDIRLHGEFQEMSGARMSADQIGVAIRYEPPVADECDRLQFLDELLVPVASPDYLRRRRDGDLRPSELLHDAEPWLGAAPDAEWAHWFRSTGQRADCLGTGRRFNLAQLAIGAALDGAGIAIGRLAIVLEDLKSERLAMAAPLAVRSGAGYQAMFANHCANAPVFRRWLLSEGQRFAEERDSWMRHKGVRIVG